MTSTSMDSNIRIVRSLKKLKPNPEIPETLEFITCFLPSPLNSLLPTPRNDQNELSHTTPPFLSSPFNDLGSLGESSSHPQLIKPPQSDVQRLSSKFERTETFLKDSGFDSVRKFLKTCSPFIQFGMSFLMMVLIVSSPSGSCQRGCRAITELP